MSEIEFIGKCLLIEQNKKMILVIGDLHLGYENVMREAGILIPSEAGEFTIPAIEFSFFNPITCKIIINNFVAFKIAPVEKRQIIIFI